MEKIINILLRRKSLFKTISWRIIVSFLSVAIVYFFTKKFAIAFSFLGVDFFLKTALYYIHDKIWDRITKPSKESKYRPIAITISWRIVATFTTLIVLDFFIETKIALLATSAEVIIKTIVFYIHEHLWQKMELTSKNLSD